MVASWYQGYRHNAQEGMLPLARLFTIDERTMLPPDMKTTKMCHQQIDPRIWIWISMDMD
jgi:hypothetical protein